MSDGMRRELAYLSSHATNRYFIPNWGIIGIKIESLAVILLGLAVIIFALGYITNRFRDVFLKILSNICLKQNYYGIIRFLQK